MIRALLMLLSTGAWLLSTATTCHHPLLDYKQFVQPGSVILTLVPTAQDEVALGNTWMLPGANLDITSWSVVTTPAGYGVGTPVIDLGPAMQGVNSTVWVAMPFSIEAAELDHYDTFNLTVDYDDGFAVFLNGNLLGDANAPSPLAFNSNASASVVGPPLQAQIEVDKDDLLVGENVIAIVGLNVDAGDADFFTGAELIAMADLGPATVSPPGGFYDAPTAVTLSHPRAGASIVYTTDGSVPTQSNGTIIPPANPDTPPAGNIMMNTTDVLRVSAFRGSQPDAPTETHSYIFHQDVVQQPSNPPGFPATWGGFDQGTTSADYEMDPTVVNDPAYASEMVGALKSIRTFSLVLPPDSLFGANGIYDNTLQRGRAWEREGSVEIFETDGDRAYQGATGIRLFGSGFSRPLGSSKKKSFRLAFRRDYGPNNLEYQLFPESPVAKHDNIMLRAQNNTSWAAGGETGAQFTQDVFAVESFRAMGEKGNYGSYAHVYVNGLYWGMYTVVQRPDEHLGEEYFGGDDDDYDAISQSVDPVLGPTLDTSEGSLDAWNELQTLAAAGVSTPAEYAAIAARMDIDNLIRYMILQQYMTNWDGPDNANNMRCFSLRVPPTPFRCMPWDMEASFITFWADSNIDANAPGNVGFIYDALRNYEEFRVRYGDLVNLYFMNDGPLSMARATARYAAVAGSIESAILGESARWGDAKVTPPRTRDQDWIPRRDELLNDWFRLRSGIQMTIYRNNDLYPLVEAPFMLINGSAQLGGSVVPTDSVALQAPAGQAGTLYYTDDGSDPRLEGGALNPTAQVYGTPFSVSASTTIKARINDGGEWSALLEGVLQIRPDLRIVELQYHPMDQTPEEEAAGFDDDDFFEFVELQNFGSQPLDLDGFVISDGIDFTFGPTLVPAGGRVLIVFDQPGFTFRYGDLGSQVVGTYSGKLSNGGESLVLTDPGGAEVLNFTYSDDWHGGVTDGDGPSLEVVDVTANPDEWNNETQWMASAGLGTPGN